MILDYVNGSNVITRVRKERVRRRRAEGDRDWRDVARSQEKPTASRSWKKEGISPLKPPEGTSPANILILTS